MMKSKKYQNENKEGSLNEKGKKKRRNMTFYRQKSMIRRRESDNKGKLH